MAKKNNNRAFVEGQIYKGKTIKEVHRVIDEYILFFTDGTRAIVKFKDL